MRIAIGLFGFLNKLFSTDEIFTHLKRSLPTDSVIDIYYFCPSILHESDPTPLNKNEIENSFKNTKLGNVYFKWYDYNPNLFIEIAEKLKLPMKSSITKMHPYRLISMYFHLSNTVQLIKDSVQSECLTYDAIIVTRNDYIPYINMYYDIFNDIPLKNGIYVLRDNMYPTNENVIYEDRVLYGTPSFMLQLNEIFNELPNILVNENALWNEYIMRVFLLNRFSPECLFYQNGIQPLKQTPIFFEFKRTGECMTMVEDLYTRFFNSRLVSSSDSP